MNIAIIIAGGMGSRTGQSIPKQFLTVKDKPILIYTLERFESCGAIQGIYVVVRPEYMAITEDYIRQFGISKVKGLVQAGSSRNRSIGNALDKLALLYAREDTVVIHHANMPFVTREEIQETVNSVDEKKIVSLMAEQYDYMARLDGRKFEFIAREGIKQFRTPEAMSLGNAMEIYGRCLREEESRPAALLFSYPNELARKLEFTYVTCSCFNFKITTYEDFKMARAIILGGDMG